MAMVADWAREAGLQPALDPHGNLWAVRSAEGPVASSGSHVDTVPDGGRYDGALGTVLALEAAIAAPDAPIALLVCAAEEAPRFGAGTLGSRLAMGTLDEAALDRLFDAGGTSARAARDGFLGELSDLPRIDALPLARVGRHIEVHIEQRHELRARGGQVGVVTHVAAPHRHEVVVEGVAGHAGEVPMADRRDALVAAAELVLALEAAARAAPLPTVATVGTLRVEPGTVSAVPGRVTLELEARGTDADAVARVEADLETAIDAVAHRRDVRVRRRLLRDGAPVALDAALVKAAHHAAARLGTESLSTHSGAGHDVQHLASLVPAVLLFVPLAGGESHTPQEEADMQDIAVAADVLLDLLTR